MPWYHFLLPLGARTSLKNFVYFKAMPPYGFKSERIRRNLHRAFEPANLRAMPDVDRFGYPYFPIRLPGELRRLVGTLETRLSSIRCPCQIIHARHDDLSSVRNAHFVHDRIGSTRKEILFLEDSYHVITAGQERATVAQRMMDFFAEETRIARADDAD